MERTGMFVVAVVVAALSVFAARLWLDRGPEELAANGSGIVSREHGDDRAAPREDNSFRARARRRGDDTAGPGAVADRSGGSAERPGDARRAAAMREEHGDVAARQPNAIGAAPPRSEVRSDLVDSLPPAQPVRNGQGDPLSPAEHEDGLLLSVANSSDIDNADISDSVGTDDKDGLVFNEDSQLVYPDGAVQGAAGTIAFDLEPQWKGDEPTDNSLVQVRNEDEWDNRLQIVKNGRYLRFILTDNTGREADISYRIDDWEPGQAHRVAATWGDARTALYVDGRLVGQNTFEGIFTPEGTPLHIGSDYTGGDYAGARATIKNFKVYDKVLPEDKLK